MILPPTLIAALLLQNPPAGAAPPGEGTPGADPALADRIREMGEQIQRLAEQQQGLATAAGLAPADGVPSLTRAGVFNGYFAIFVVAFLVTLLATPFMRWVALRVGIVDRPSEARKAHRVPVPYLGGVAVFLGLLAGIVYSYLAAPGGLFVEYHDSPKWAPGGEGHQLVPGSIVLGLFVILLVGLLDDWTGIPPRVKVGGQLFAAAALAATDVGVRLAEGVLAPLGRMVGNAALKYTIPLPDQLPVFGGAIEVDLVYWTGTAIIAVFVLGACNASNLVDGLDGLLSGVTGIAAAGLLVIALGMAVMDNGPRDAQRIILCLALLGACLGFLPHNFNPATIFLGDAGSLLLGFTTIVIILTLGDTGQTQWVIAGLLVYAVPIIDTVLAIVRRKMAGKPLSAADDQHLHHMLKRSLGGVKPAVLMLYAIGAGFAVLGVAVTILVRARVIYALALLFVAFIVVTAYKVAWRTQLEEQIRRLGTGARAGESRPGQATPPRPPAPREPEPAARD